MLIALPLIGLLVGVLIVSLGGGGGAVYVGILTVLFNVPPGVAAATSLATSIPTIVIGAIGHRRAGNVDIKVGVPMLVGGVVGAVAGSLVSGSLPLALYDRITGVVLLLLAAQMLISRLRRKGADHRIETGNGKLVKATVFGLFGGIMAGLVGLSGGGPIIAGLMILGLSAIEAVGTSLFVLLGISVTGFLVHLGTGSIDWRLVGLLSIGTVCGAIIGPRLLARVDKERLEHILAPALFIMVIVMGAVLVIR